MAGNESATCIKRTHQAIEDVGGDRTVKRLKTARGSHIHDLLRRVESAQGHGRDVVVNYGRLHASLCNEGAHDEIHIDITPSPVHDGSKTIKFKSSVMMTHNEHSPKHTFPACKTTASHQLVHPKPLPPSHSEVTLPSDAPIRQANVASSTTLEPELHTRLPSESSHADHEATPDASYASKNARSTQTSRLSLTDFNHSTLVNENYADANEDTERQKEPIIVPDNIPQSAQNAERQALHDETSLPIARSIDAEVCAVSSQAPLAVHFTEPRHKPLGLPCIGRTDYRTVVIQAIAHSQRMRDYLQRLTGWDTKTWTSSSDHAAKLHKKNDKDCMSCGLRKVVGDIWGERDGRITDKSQNDFHKMVQLKYNRSLRAAGQLENPSDWRSSNSTQTTPGVALEWFLELLHEENEKLAECKLNDNTFSYKFDMNGTCGNDRCGAQSLLQDRLLNVLDLNVYNDPEDLEDAISRARQGEVNVEETPCTAEKCRKNSRHHVITELISAPDVLFVQLQSRQEQTINQTWLRYETKLNLGPYVRGREDDINYNLVAIITYTEDSRGVRHYLIHARSRHGVFRHDDNWRSERIPLADLANPYKLRDRHGKLTKLSMLVYDQGDLPSDEELDAAKTEKAAAKDVEKATASQPVTIDESSSNNDDSRERAANVVEDPSGDDEDIEDETYDAYMEQQMKSRARHLTKTGRARKSATGTVPKWLRTKRAWRKPNGKARG